MKKCIKILSVVLLIVVLLSTQILSASAVITPIFRGHIDDDNGCSITDATYIQRHLAQLEEMTPTQFYAADVDGDEKVSVIDATYIQQKLAEIIHQFPAGDYCFIDVYAEALVSDYSSGKAKAGTPVTFEAVASGGPGELMYEFYIDGELVRESSKNNTFVHTFEEPGTYEVEYYVSNAVGVTTGENIYYTVVLPYETGWVNLYSIYHKGFYDHYLTFEAIAYDGNAPYEYSFALYDQTYESGSESSGILVEKQDYSQSNSFTLTTELEDNHYYTLYVDVKDADGHTDSDTLGFEYMLPPPA
ncbi:MAG: PKD domain-containing protein [Ruminococcaceae bacterium]|nr:PKD domain-containing protein [Oscillospiraceae bacterium]